MLLQLSNSSRVIEAACESHGGLEAWLNVHSFRGSFRKLSGAIPVFKGLGKTFDMPQSQALPGATILTMSEETKRVAAFAQSIPPRDKKTIYPEQFASRVAGREKRPLGDFFGLKNFGVNLTRLAPGAESALRHSHEKQDEFVYILEGTPTLVTDAGEEELGPGMCVGFRAGTGNAHHLINRSSADVVCLEVGDRTPNESASYPDDDLKVDMVDGAWRVSRKDGSPY